MPSVFDWKGAPSIVSADRQYRTFKGGRTQGQVSTASIEQRRAKGQNPGYVPGMGKSESIPPRVGGRVKG